MTRAPSSDVPNLLVPRTLLAELTPPPPPPHFGALASVNPSASSDWLWV